MAPCSEMLRRGSRKQAVPTFYMALNPELLEILRCPKCKSKVELKPDESALKCVNAECSLVYAVKDDIPVMIIEEATVEK